MSIDVQLGRVRSTYQLPDAESDRASELDRAMDRVLNRELASALERQGLDPAAQMCVRHVQVRLEVDSWDTVDELARRWTDVIAATIVERITGSDPDVRVYRDERAVRAEVLEHALRDDLTPMWAWQLTRVVPHQTSTTSGALAAVLADDPQAIVPLLARAARRGDAATVVGRVGPGPLVEAIRRVLHAAQSLVTLEQVAAIAGEPPPPQADDASHPAEPASPPTPSRSPGRRQAELGVTSAAVIVATTLDQDPRSLSTGSVAMVADRLRQHGSRLALPPAGAATTPAHSTEPDDPSIAPPAVSGGHGRPAPMDPDDPSIAPPAVSGGHGRPAPKDPDATQTHDDDGAPETVDQPGTGDADAPPDLLISPVAGLLFLIRVIAELGTVDQLTTALDERHTRWALHRLGLALTSADPFDPAVLAFAGLTPDDGPDVVAERAEESELQVVHDAAGSIADRLAELLGRDEDPPALVVAQATDRRGWFRFAPGWVDVELELESVDVDIRRVGLDIDPGYIPWTGTVVRFRYV